MLALGPYLVAVLATTIFVAAIAFAAYALRRRILPAWSGASARLGEAVLAVGFVTGLGLILGVVGLINRPALLLAAIAVALLAGWAERSGRSGTQPSSQSDDPPALLGAEQPAFSRLAALAVITIVFAHWGIGVSWSLDAGITNFDSVWYHLPFSAEIAQSGSILPLTHIETVFLNWFYPQGSELLHALGMVLTDRDLPSLALNLGWLGLAFLAAWCIGRPFGRGHLTVAAAAILLECHNLVAREPGTAKNDIVVIALLLAAVALMINLARPSVGDKSYVMRSDHRPRRNRGERGGAGRLAPGWPLALTGLAVGLAAGTKVTALAPAAGLTLAALAVSPTGRRWWAALWWGGGLAAGGAFWYLRNLIVSGNPLPQIRSIGPIDLPGPERLQTGRPDFTVSHYLFDGDVWRDYFAPGLERGFGSLWPLVIAAALAGGLLAAGHLLTRDSPSRNSRGSLIGWLGLAALIGIVAYLFTPLGAAGPEGSPTAFAINLRFVIPALILGLVLLPLALPFRSSLSGWLWFGGLVLTGLATNGAQGLLSGSGRPFGWFLAFGLLVLPAALVRLVAGAPASSGRRGVVVAAAYLVAVVAVCFPLQRGYFENRYADFEPGLGLSEIYRWASEQRQTEIGLAGTTLGFHSYGFYGPDLSNQVTYLGKRAPRGGFQAIDECEDFRRAVNRADPDYLVTSPFLNFIDVDSPIPSPEARWIKSDPAIVPETTEGEVTLWRVEGDLSERCGAAEEPHRELPDTPLD